MKERLFEIIKRNELTAWRFAELLEVQPSSISHILSGRNKPSFDFIEKILTKFPEINPDWLILGRGDMVRTGYSEELVIHEADHLSQPTLFDLTEEDVEGDPVITNVITADNEDDTESEKTIITNVIHNKSENITQESDKTAHNMPIVNTDNIERVMVFYTDGTYSNYNPRK